MESLPRLEHVEMCEQLEFECSAVLVQGGLQGVEEWAAHEVLVVGEEHRLDGEGGEQCLEDDQCKEKDLQQEG